MQRHDLYFRFDAGKYLAEANVTHMPLTLTLLCNGEHVCRLPVKALTQRTYKRRGEALSLEVPMSYALFNANEFTGDVTRRSIAAQHGGGGGGGDDSITSSSPSPLDSKTSTPAPGHRSSSSSSASPHHHHHHHQQHHQHVQHAQQPHPQQYTHDDSFRYAKLEHSSDAAPHHYSSAQPPPYPAAHRRDSSSNNSLSNKSDNDSGLSSGSISRISSNSSSSSGDSFDAAAAVVGSGDLNNTAWTSNRPLIKPDPYAELQRSSSDDHGGSGGGSAAAAATHHQHHSHGLGYASTNASASSTNLSADVDGDDALEYHHNDPLVSIFDSVYKEGIDMQQQHVFLHVAKRSEVDRLAPHDDSTGVGYVVYIRTNGGKRSAKRWFALRQDSWYRLEIYTPYSILSASSSSSSSSSSASAPPLNLRLFLNAHRAYSEYVPNVFKTKPQIKDERITPDTSIQILSGMGTNNWEATFAKHNISTLRDLAAVKHLSDNNPIRVELSGHPGYMKFVENAARAVHFLETRHRNMSKACEFFLIDMDDPRSMHLARCSAILPGGTTSATNASNHANGVSNSMTSASNGSNGKSTANANASPIGVGVNAGAGIPSNFTAFSSSPRSLSPSLSVSSSSSTSGKSGDKSSSSSSSSSDAPLNLLYNPAQNSSGGHRGIPSFAASASGNDGDFSHPSNASMNSNLSVSTGGSALSTSSTASPPSSSSSVHNAARSSSSSSSVAASSTMSSSPYPVARSPYPSHAATTTTPSNPALSYHQQQQPPPQTVDRSTASAQMETRRIESNLDLPQLAFDIVERMRVEQGVMVFSERANEDNTLSAWCDHVIRSCWSVFAKYPYKEIHASSQRRADYYIERVDFEERLGHLFTFNNSPPLHQNELATLWKVAVMPNLFLEQMTFSTFFRLFCFLFAGSNSRQPSFDLSTLISFLNEHLDFFEQWTFTSHLSLFMSRIEAERRLSASKDPDMILLRFSEGRLDRLIVDGERARPQPIHRQLVLSARRPHPCNDIVHHLLLTPGGDMNSGRIAILSPDGRSLYHDLDFLYDAGECVTALTVQDYASSTSRSGRATAPAIVQTSYRVRTEVQTPALPPRSAYDAGGGGGSGSISVAPVLPSPSSSSQQLPSLAMDRASSNSTMWPSVPVVGGGGAGGGAGGGVGGSGGSGGAGAGTAPVVQRKRHCADELDDVSVVSTTTTTTTTISSSGASSAGVPSSSSSSSTASASSAASIASTPSVPRGRDKAQVRSALPPPSAYHSTFPSVPLSVLESAGSTRDGSRLSSTTSVLDGSTGPVGDHVDGKSAMVSTMPVLGATARSESSVLHLSPEQHQQHQQQHHAYAYPSDDHRQQQQQQHPFHHQQQQYSHQPSYPPQQLYHPHQQDPNQMQQHPYHQHPHQQLPLSDYHPSSQPAHSMSSMPPMLHTQSSYPSHEEQQLQQQQHLQHHQQHMQQLQAQQSMYYQHPPYQAYLSSSGPPLPPQPPSSASPLMMMPNSYGGGMGMNTSMGMSGIGGMSNLGNLGGLMQPPSGLPPFEVSPSFLVPTIPSHSTSFHGDLGAAYGAGPFDPLSSSGVGGVGAPSSSSSLLSSSDPASLFHPNGYPSNM